MSNPGVIVLDTVNCKSTKLSRFQIEDNIGEAIHIHMDNIRLDLTIPEFLDLASSIKKILNNKELLGQHGLIELDPSFLKAAIDFLPKVTGLIDERVKISDLQCIVFSRKFRFDWIELRPINKTPAFKYLKGDKDEFVNYNQFNYQGTDNVTRLESLLHSINNTGFNTQISQIILFGHSNQVRDGQHRLAVLAYLHGLDYEVSIKRLLFSSEQKEIDIQIKNIEMALRKILRFIRRTLLGILG